MICVKELRSNNKLTNEKARRTRGVSYLRGVAARLEEEIEMEDNG